MLATIALLSAALARIGRQAGVPGPTGLLVGTIVLVVIALAWDWRASGRVHAVLLWGGLICIASQPIREFLSWTPVWMAIAHRLLDVPEFREKFEALRPELEAALAKERPAGAK